jgi:hypothetical protein
MFQNSPTNCMNNHNDLRCKEFKGIEFNNRDKMAYDVYQCPMCGTISKFPRPFAVMDLEDPEYIKRMLPTEDWLNRMMS